MGYFISFEGIDGCGKSTQLQQLGDWIRKQGHAVCTTFEPGDTELGRDIRQILLHGTDPVPEAELFLFLADRAEHVVKVIQPALARGEWVLCDRYSDSTRAYQLAGRKLAQGEDLEYLLTAAEIGVSPLYTIWLDLPVEQAMERMAMRSSAGGASTRLDQESLNFHRRVQSGFKAIWQNNPDRVLRLPADKSIDEIQQQIRLLLSELCDQWPE